MNRKGMISIMVAAATALSMSAAAFAGETETQAEVFENQGMTLSIPEEYKDLVIVTTPDDGGRELFRVCEKASVDALEKTGESYDYKILPEWSSSHRQRMAVTTSTHMPQMFRSSVRAMRRWNRA